MEELQFLCRMFNCAADEIEEALWSESKKNKRLFLQEAKNGDFSETIQGTKEGEGTGD